MSVMSESVRHTTCRVKANGIRTPEYPRHGEDVREWADRMHRDEITAALERIRLAGGWKELSAEAGVTVQHISACAHDPEKWRSEDMSALYKLDPDAMTVWRIRHYEDVKRGCEVNHEFFPGEPLVLAMRGTSCAH